MADSEISCRINSNAFSCVSLVMTPVSGEFVRGTRGKNTVTDFFPLWSLVFSWFTKKKNGVRWKNPRLPDNDVRVPMK
jgi:hypothetical protein